MAEEIKEVTLEEKAVAWEIYVRSELNSVLDIFLPISQAGNVGVQYGSPEIGKLEDGTVMFDDSKASAVMINIVLKFEKPIDMPK